MDVASMMNVTPSESNRHAAFTRTSNHTQAGPTIDGREAHAFARDPRSVDRGGASQTAPLTSTNLPETRCDDESAANHDFRSLICGHDRRIASGDRRLLLHTV